MTAPSILKSARYLRQLCHKRLQESLPLASAAAGETAGETAQTLRAWSVVVVQFPVALQAQRMVIVTAEDGRVHNVFTADGALQVQVLEGEADGEFSPDFQLQHLVFLLCHPRCCSAMQKG